MDAALFSCVYTVRMATVIEMMLQTSPYNWLVRLLSNLAMEQDSSLIQDRLASRENFRVVASLTYVSVIRKSTEGISERSAPALASSFALQFTGIS